MKFAVRTTLASVVAIGAVAVGACVSNDVSAVGSADDAGTTTDATSGGDDAGADGAAHDAGPTCRTDQLVCDGACVDVGPQHCGGCSIVCPSTAPLCSSGSGTPTCVASCNPGETKCGEQCVATATNPSNCGACGTKCPTPLNGVATCANSTCDFSCKTSYHACGASCEADDDPMHCGATCKTCTAPSGATAVCNGGSCTFTCSSGTACIAQNLCTNTNTDLNNCGTCGKACAVATSCTVGACNVTFGNATPAGNNTSQTTIDFVAGQVDIPIAMTVTKLGTYAYYNGSTGQYSFWLGLYTNNGGHPGSLVVAAKGLVTAQGAQELTVTPTVIAAGTYFIGATQSTWAYYGQDTSTGGYVFAHTPGTSYWNDSAAPATAPATTTATPGSYNFYLMGKE